MSLATPTLSGHALAFLFGGTGTGEIVLIFVVLLLLFGPRKLPEVARMLGRILHQLRSASDEFRSQIMNMDHEDATPSVDVESQDVEDGKEESKEDSEDDRDLAG